MKHLIAFLSFLLLATVLQAQSFTDSLSLDGNLQFALLPVGILNNASVFTVEFWTKTTESRTSGTFWQRPYLFGIATANDNSGDFGITTDNGYISVFEGFSNNGTDQTFESPTVKINDNVWHHIAAVNNGTKLYLYVDGNVVDSLVSGHTIITANAPLTVGASSLDFNQGSNSIANTTFPSQGTFASLRVSDTVRYNANFTPATSFVTDVHTVALYNFSGKCGVQVPDISANHNDLTVNNATPLCATLPFTADLSFNGSTQSVSTPVRTLNDSLTFTIETWFRSTDLGSNATLPLAPTIFGLENAGSVTGDIGLVTQGGYARLWDDMNAGNSNGDNTPGRAFVCDGQWHHLAAVANGTTLSLYVDGINEGSLPITRGINSFTHPLTFMRINSQSWGSTAYHAGEIDEVRLSSKARYTANFTPSAIPFLPDANTTALYHFDNCGSGTTPDASANHADAIVTAMDACGVLPPQQLQGKILYSYHNRQAKALQDSIYTLDSTGKKEFITFGYRPRLSHDGKFLAFTNGPNSNQSYGASLWIRDLTSREEKLTVFNNDYLDYYDFYPGNNRLVYSEGCNIFTTNIDGSAAYTYLNGYPGDCFSDDPTIRISDSVIAYHNVHYGLYTMNPDGTNPAIIPNTVPGDLVPNWSPDGQWIAYYKPIPGSYNGSAGAYVPTNSVYKIRPNGTDSTRLSFFSLTDTLAADPIWTSDMKSLYVIGRIKDTMGLFQVSTDGSGEYHRIYNFHDSIGSVADYWLGLSDYIKTNLLPLTLLKFTGEKAGNGVYLNWQTTRERNNSHFDIERSVNGVAYSKIGTVSAKAGNGVSNSYDFTDADLPTASKKAIYYRLKQVDIDGNFKFSNIVAINLASQPKIVVYPNPSNGSFTITAPAIIQKLNVSVFDTEGRQVYQQTFGNTATAAVKLSVSKGIYLLRVYDGTNTINQKLLVR